MIITRIVSGLGNQMFQYAAGHALAARRGVPHRLDLRFFDTQTLRRYELHRFAVSARPITQLDRLRISVSADPPHRDLPRRIARRLPLRRLSLRHEWPNTVDPTIVTAADYTALLGYWQSESFFADAADGIRREFTFGRPPDAENAAVLDRIRRGPGTPVCVHVRRGDYLSGTEVLTACPLRYYVDALGWIGQRVSDAHHVVFSDDPDWARANLPVPASSTFVTHNAGKNDPEDMRLMSACRHFIIANSTFSWWGAWLSTSAGKLVVAPQRWFAIDHPGEAAVVPATWTRL